MELEYYGNKMQVLYGKFVWIVNKVMHKLHFCKIPMLIQCHRNDSDMSISRSKHVQWKNWNDRME